MGNRGEGALHVSHLVKPCDAFRFDTALGMEVAVTVAAVEVLNGCPTFGCKLLYVDHEVNENATFLPEEELDSNGVCVVVRRFPIPQDALIPGRGLVRAVIRLQLLADFPLRSTKLALCLLPPASHAAHDIYRRRSELLRMVRPASHGSQTKDRTLASAGWFRRSWVLHNRQLNGARSPARSPARPHLAHSYTYLQ